MLHASLEVQALQFAKGASESITFLRWQAEFGKQKHI
jgi:hypothetical protein